MLESYIIWEPRGVCFTQTGALYTSVLLDALIRIGAHPHFDRFRYVIADLTACPPLTRCRDTLDPIMAQMIGAYYSNPRIAVHVASSDPLVLRLARILQRNVLWELHTVSALNEARQSVARIAR